MSTTFSLTRNQVIESALRLQGWLEEGTSASATKLGTMAEALQSMLKAWATQGMKIWTVQELTLPLVSGQRTYTIGPSGNLVANRPLLVMECFCRYLTTDPAAYTDVTLQRLSQEEYQALGNKNTTGTPNSFFYLPTLTNGTFYAYVTPNSSASTQNEVHIFSRRQINDINSNSDPFDFPNEWYQALRWGLADETSLENQVSESLADRIAVRAKNYREALEDWDNEYASVYFQPDVRMGR